MLTRASVMLAMLCILPVSAAERRDPGTERRGSLAFHYGGALTSEQLRFFGKFDVLVTHDPLPAKQVAALRSGGTRLVLYEWAVAFYRTLVREGAWHDRLLKQQRATLLNRKPLRGHLGASDADAFYYDPANEAQNAARVRAIAKRLASIGYDGVFLDTTTVESVHPDALREFRRRHPGVEYDVAYARFLALLRKQLAIIVTNQGYRAAEHYLPYADYDVTESLISRPWHDASNRWNSVDFLVPELILKPASKFPSVRFVHLAYVEKDDPARIETLIATARLYDHDAFVAFPDVARTAVSDLYFFEAGRPEGEIRYDGLTASRSFEHADVVVTPERARITRDLP